MLTKLLLRIVMGVAISSFAIAGLYSPRAEAADRHHKMPFPQQIEDLYPLCQHIDLEFKEAFVDCLFTQVKAVSTLLDAYHDISLRDLGVMKACILKSRKEFGINFAEASKCYTVVSESLRKMLEDEDQ